MDEDGCLAISGTLLSRCLVFAHFLLLLPWDGVGVAAQQFPSSILGTHIRGEGWCKEYYKLPTETHKIVCLYSAIGLFN